MQVTNLGGIKCHFKANNQISFQMTKYRSTTHSISLTNFPLLLKWNYRSSVLKKFTENIKKDLWQYDQFFTSRYFEMFDILRYLPK